MSNSNKKSSYQDLARNMGSEEKHQADPADDQKEEAAQASLGFPSHAEVEKQLAQVEAERDELKNKYLHTLADMENLRRRTEVDISNAHKFGLKKFAQELLPIVDSLEQGLALEVKGDALAAKLHEGMQLTLEMLLKTLDKFYIKQVAPAVGEAFNVEFHQAMSSQSGTDAPANTILQVLQKGYTLHDRLLRPALVIVAK